MEKNTVQVWDKVQEHSIEQDRYSIRKVLNSLEWRRTKKLILDKFGSFKGLKSIEIGAGQGKHSVVLALKGVDVTVLDYSKSALEASKILFKRFNCKGKFILMDALNLDKKLLSKFDISMSYGTAEHFIGEKRTKFIKTHFDVLKKEGITFISVPNKLNLPYRTWMFLSQIFGKWRYGEEYPFSIWELKKIGNKIGKDFSVFGSNLFFTKFQFIRRIKKFFLGNDGFYKSSKERFATPLDKYLSQTIIAFGIKN